MLADLAMRDGHAVVAFDLFGDLDLRRSASTVVTRGALTALVQRGELLAEPDEPFVSGGDEAFVVGGHRAVDQRPAERQRPDRRHGPDRGSNGRGLRGRRGR